MNRAAYMNGIKNIEYENIEMPVPDKGEVLIKLEYVGICGSDVHFYEHGRIGDFVVDGKFILGHESGGSVVAVGEGVKTLKPGDKVALEPGVTCGQCEFCKSGRYNLCPDVKFFATPPYDGTFRDYISFPENMCFKLPDNVSTMEGALVEPLAVGLHAAKQGNVTLGDTVVILGSGCIGLVSILASRAYGASKIIVVDVLDKRLKFAEDMGADYVINAKKEDAIAAVEKLTEGNGADIVIETAGNKITIGQTSHMAKRGGTVVLVGLAAEDEINYNFAKVMNKELTIKSVFRYRNLYQIAVNAIASGSIDVKKIVTHEFGFDEIKKGFDYVIENSEDVVKAVIRIGEPSSED